MASFVTVSFNGDTYEIPNPHANGWGQFVTDFLAAIANGTLQPSGGLFTLTNEVDFGSSFGLKSIYYKTRTTGVATSGQFRLANSDSIVWRNFAGNGNLPLAINNLNQLTYNGDIVVTSGSGLIQWGDITGTLSNQTDLQSALDAKKTIATGNNYKWETTGATGLLQETTVTASRAIASDANGLPVASATTATELGYVSGVTSSIQTQFGTKANLAGAAFTGDISLSNQHQIRLLEQTGNGTNYIALEAPDTVTSNSIWKLPDGNGAAGHFLQTDGGSPANLIWASAITSPAGNDTYVQYNDVSSFGADSNFTWDKISKVLLITDGSIQSNADDNTGGFNLQGNSAFYNVGATCHIQFNDPTNSEYVRILGNNIVSTYDLYLPANQGASSTFLQNDGSGNLSWVTNNTSNFATKALDNLAAVAVNTSLISDTDNTDDLGSSSITWKRLYLKTGLLLQETGVGTDAITLRAPASLTSSYNLTLPDNDGSPNQVLTTDGSGNTSWETNSATTVWGDITGTLSNQTDLQSALDAKKTIATGNNYKWETTGATGLLQETTVTASKAVVTDANGLPSASATTSTEIGYINGVTSSVQTQLNSKASIALDNLASVAINTSLISDTHDTDDLGSSSKNWRSLYLGTSLVLQETGAGTDAITIQSPATITAWTLTLPDSNGDPGQFLQTDGSGVTSWQDATASVAWGDITGTLSDQTDLQSALNAKKTIATGNAYKFETTDASGNLQETTVTASRAVATDANGLPVASATTATELGYVNGVTSAIQTQINTKKTIATGNAYRFETTGATGDLQETAVTASRAVVTDANGLPTASATTSTEIGYVNGVTSAIQTQLDGKANTALSNLASVAINTTLVSDTDNTDDLGSSAITWKNAYLKTGLVLQETGTGTDAITLRAASAITTGYTITLPADQGVASSFAQNDGSGNLSWADLAVSNITPVGDETIVSNTIAIVQPSYAIASGKTLSVGSGADLFIQGDTPPLTVSPLNRSLTSDASTTSSTLTPIGNLGWFIVAGEIWNFEAFLPVTGITGGTEYGINATSGSTVMTVWGNTSAVGTYSMDRVTAVNTASAVAMATSNTTALYITLTGQIKTTSTTPVWAFLQFKSVTDGNTSTVKAGAILNAFRNTP